MSGNDLISRHSTRSLAGNPWIPCQWAQGMTILLLILLSCFSASFAVPTADAPAAGGGKSVTPDEMNVEIKGQFRADLIKKVWLR